MSIKSQSILAFSALLIALSAVPARAAIELAPGQWQVTEAGSQNGEPVKPKIASDCVTPEDAKDPFKKLLATEGAGAQCKKFDVKETGNVVSVDMQCSDGKGTSVAVSGSYTFLSQRHYTGSIKSTIIRGANKTTAYKTLDVKWIGACAK